MVKVNAMNILERKQEIKSDIDKVKDEVLLDESERLLHLDETEVPEWHKKILEERLKEIDAGSAEMLDWDDVKKDL